MKKLLSWLVGNIVSFWKDGRTLGQKKRFIHSHYPALYRALYEE